MLVLNSSIANVFEHLRQHIETGEGYAAVEPPKCTLSVIFPMMLPKAIGDLCWVKQICKRCYTLRSPQPQHVNLLSVDKVLEWLITVGFNNVTSFMSFTQNLSLYVLSGP